MSKMEWWLRQVTKTNLGLLNEAGIDTTNIEKATHTFHRLPKGNTLHHEDCSAINRKKTVREKVQLSNINDWNRHDGCWAWSSGYHYELLDYVAAGMTLHETKEAVRALQDQQVPRYADAGKLKETIESTMFATQLAILDKEDEKDTLLEDLTQVTKRWAGIPREWRARPFVVNMMSCPMESVSILGLPSGSGAGRGARPAWKAWQEHVEAEQGLEDARSAAKDIWAETLTMLEEGDPMRSVTSSDLDRLVDTWEGALEEATRHLGGDVLIAWPYLGRSGVSGSSRLGQVATAYGIHQDSNTHAYAMRVPETIGEMLCLNDGNSHVWLGDASDLTDAHVETFLGLWDARSEDVLSNASAALLAARTI